LNKRRCFGDFVHTSADSFPGIILAHILGAFADVGDVLMTTLSVAEVMARASAGSNRGGNPSESCPNL